MICPNCGHEAYPSFIIPNVAAAGCAPVYAPVVLREERLIPGNIIAQINRAAACAPPMTSVIYNVRV